MSDSTETATQRIHHWPVLTFPEKSLIIISQFRLGNNELRNMVGRNRRKQFYIKGPFVFLPCLTQTDSTWCGISFTIHFSRLKGSFKTCFLLFLRKVQKVLVNCLLHLFVVLLTTCVRGFREKIKCFNCNFMIYPSIFANYQAVNVFEVRL